MAEKKEIHDVVKQLEAGIKDLFQSDRYMDYLKTMSKFHSYSINNIMIIHRQMPDATLVASYGRWKKLHRYVKRGERGIKILAPCPYSVMIEKEMVDKDGNSVTETTKVKRTAFKLESVFDISQTDGEPLPELVKDLDGQVTGFSDFREAICRTASVPVGFEDMKDGTHGYYHVAEKRIAIKNGMSEAQTIKTMVHELAHSILHSKEALATSGENPTRETKEVEAESVAYVVCNHFALDSSDYSFGYIGGWSEGKELPELKASLDSIRNTAHFLIEEIERNLKDVREEKPAA